MSAVSLFDLVKSKEVISVKDLREAFAELKESNQESLDCNLLVNFIYELSNNAVSSIDMKNIHEMVEKNILVFKDRMKDITVETPEDMSFKTCPEKMPPMLTAMFRGMEDLNALKVDSRAVVSTIKDYEQLIDSLLETIHSFIVDEFNGLTGFTGLAQKKRFYDSKTADLKSLKVQLRALRESELKDTIKNIDNMIGFLMRLDSSIRMCRGLQFDKNILTDPETHGFEITSVG